MQTRDPCRWDCGRGRKQEETLSAPHSGSTAVKVKMNKRKKQRVLRGTQAAFPFPLELHKT